MATATVPSYAELRKGVKRGKRSSNMSEARKAEIARRSSIATGRALTALKTAYPEAFAAYLEAARAEVEAERGELPE